MLFTILAISLCVMASAFFAGAETAVTGVSRARLYHLIQSGDARAHKIGELRKDKETLIGALLLGNSVVHILGSALATNLAVQRFGEEGVFYATGIMTVVVVIFGEVLPKTYAIMNSELVTLRVSYILWVVVRLLTPFTVAIGWINRPFLKLMNVNRSQESTDISSSDIIRGTVEMHHDEGNVPKQQRDMLGTILDLDEIAVSEVMTHRINLEAVDFGLSVDEVVNAIIHSNHTRLPVWVHKPENIIGVLHVKSLLKELRDKKDLNHADLEVLLVKPWFIPDTTTLKEQLQAFRQRRQHLALVVDEYGDLKGMLTLEDILEEIVGKIDDEYDWRYGGVVSMGHNVYQVEGTTTIRDLNRQLDWELPDANAATLAGLILDEARVIPDIGDSFEFHGVRFTIRGRHGHQITRIWAEKLPEPDEGEDAMGE